MFALYDDKNSSKTFATHSVQLRKKL